VTHPRRADTPYRKSERLAPDLRPTGTLVHKIVRDRRAWLLASATARGLLPSRIPWRDVGSVGRDRKSLLLFAGVGLRCCRIARECATLHATSSAPCGLSFGIVIAQSDSMVIARGGMSPSIDTW